MAEWWEALNLVQQILWFIAALSTLVLVVQLFLNLIGLASHDVDVDTSAAGDVGLPADVGVTVDHADLAAHSSGLALLSFRTVTAFFVGFGWAGIVLLDAGLSTVPSIVLAVCVGCFFVLVVFYLMKELLGLSESGNVDLQNAVGRVGKVYLPVPARGAGAGQVQVVVQGRLREICAITDHEEKLPVGLPVKVVKLIDTSTFLVQKLES